MFSLSDRNADPPAELKGLVTDPPLSWQGMELAWTTNARPELVYLDSFDVRGWRGVRGVHLLGARYELAEALVGGDNLGDGYFLEYFVADERSDRYSVHRLLQSTSVTYSERDEEADYIPAADVGETASLSINHPPSWTVSEAMWPTVDGEAMMFVGQLALPDTEVSRRLLTWDTTVFLFMSRLPPLQFKVVEQPSHAQSAEEHYHDEGG